jgi:DNA-binding FrmR family transcriptional regulator
MSKSSALHKSHPHIIKRLLRVEGHLRSTIAMIEQGRRCLDLAQQLHAVEKAVAQAKKTLVHDHIDNCLEHAVRANAGDGHKPWRNSRPSANTCSELVL